HRLGRSRTPGFQPGNRGSNPLGAILWSAKIAVFRMSWPFLCLWLSTQISCLVQILSKQVDKTKFPKFGRPFSALRSAFSKLRAYVLNVNRGSECLASFWTTLAGVWLPTVRFLL
ncbi:MAG: hypothetical protein ACFFCW_24130, partial [Candidatus Hodarchaeota archaeon]